MSFRHCCWCGRGLRRTELATIATVRRGRPQPGYISFSDFLKSLYFMSCCRYDDKAFHTRKCKTGRKTGLFFLWQCSNKYLTNMFKYSTDTCNLKIFTLYLNGKILQSIIPQRKYLSLNTLNLQVELLLTISSQQNKNYIQ